MEAYNNYTTRIFEFCENDTIWLRFNTSDFTFYWTENGVEYSTSDFLFSLDDSDMFFANIDLNSKQYKFGSKIDVYKNKKAEKDVSAQIKIIKKPLMDDKQSNAFHIMKKLTNILHKINNIKLSFDFNEFYTSFKRENYTIKDPLGNSIYVRGNLKNGDSTGADSIQDIRGFPPKYKQTSVMPVKINGWKIINDGYIESSLDISLKFLSLGWRGSEVILDTTKYEQNIVSDLPVEFEVTYNSSNYFALDYMNDSGIFFQENTRFIIPTSISGKLIVKTSVKKDKIIFIYDTGSHKYDFSHLVYSVFNDGLFHKIDDLITPHNSAMESFKYTPYWIF